MNIDKYQHLSEVEDEAHKQSISLSEGEGRNT
jgi:hypothetical protein